jgi:hypothetical protein
MPPLSPAERWALTPPFHPYLILPEEAIGGVFSVALSRAPMPVGRVGVTHHRVLPCSDFPQAGFHPAAAALPHGK